MKYLFPIFFLFSNSVYAQTEFERYYTFNNWAWISQIFDFPGKGYFAVGYSDSLVLDSVGNPEIDYLNAVLINIDYNGDTIKTFSYGNSDTAYLQLYGRNSDDFARNAMKTSDGNIILTGETQSYNAQNIYDYDLWFIKLTPLLDTLWMKTFSIPDTAIVTSLVNVSTITNEKGFAVSGAQRCYGNNCYFQAHITVFDSLGNLKFHSRLLPQNHCYLQGIVQTSDNGFIATGELDNIPYTDASPLIIKVDSSGNYQWHIVLPFSGDFNYAENIIKTLDGNYVFVWENVVTIGSNKLWHYHANKIDEQGATLWQKDYVYSFDSHQRVAELPNGNLMVSGIFSDTLGYTTMGYLMLADSNGDSLWTRKFRGNPTSVIRCIAGNPTSDGGFILGGETYCCNTHPLFGQTSSMWVIKTDSLGLILSSNEIGKPIVKDYRLGVPYPNPAIEEISINILTPFTENNTESILLLFDISGRQINSYDISPGINIKKLDVSQLRAGEYLLALSVNGYNAGVVKFIKK